MVSGHATLTPTRLHAMAKLYQAGVDGAAEQIVDLARTSPDALSAALGVDREWVDSFVDNADAADLIVEAIESTSRRALERRRAKARKRAELLARELATHSTVSDNGIIDLDIGGLNRIARVAGFRWLGIPVRGRRCVFGRPQLNLVLRECRTTRIEQVSADVDALNIRYQTSCGRGHLRLLPYGGSVREEDVLLVPIRARGVQRDIHQDIPVSIPPSGPLAPPVPEDHRPVLARVLHALTESMAS